MTTGEKIAELRRGQGISQEALADRLAISRQAVSKWEADLAAPSRDKLLELTEVFGVSADALLRPDAAAEASRVDVQPANVQTDAAANAKPSASARRWAHGISLLFALAMAVGLVVCFVWLTRLQAQLDGVSGQTIITLPGEPTATADITDYTIYRTYDPVANALTFTVTVLPHAHSEGETAQLVVRGSEVHTADAVWESGAYSAAVTAPLTDRYSLSLLVMHEGITRTLPIEVQTDLLRQYQLDVSVAFSGALRSVDAGARLDGGIGIHESIVRDDATGKPGVYLTAAKVTLYIDGVAVETKDAALDPLDEDGGRTVTRAALVDFSRVLYSRDAYFITETTDNFGRTAMQRTPLPAQDIEILTQP